MSNDEDEIIRPDNTLDVTDQWNLELRIHSVMTRLEARRATGVDGELAIAAAVAHALVEGIRHALQVISESVFDATDTAGNPIRFQHTFDLPEGTEWDVWAARYDEDGNERDADEDAQ